MRAAVYYAPKDIRIEDIAEPEPGPGQVLLAVSRNGICGSDLHTYIGGSSGGASMHLPGIVLGHEFAGIVQEVGPGVEDLPVGTAVAVAPTEHCGECWSCRHAHPNLCRSLGIYGGYRLPLHGGLAPLVAVSRRSCHVVPDGLGAVEAALAEPMAVAVHTVRRAPVTFGASVAVLGGGPIGLAILQAALAGGAASVIVSETSTARRGAASRLGATAVIDPNAESLTACVRDLTEAGVDIVYDTTAVSAAFNSGISSLRPRGTLVSMAGWSADAQVDIAKATAKELDMRFVMTYEPDVDFPIALGLLRSGGFNHDVMITDHIPLDGLIEKGIEELLHRRDNHIKILVDPNA